MQNFIQKGDKLTFTESDLTHPSHSDNLVNSGDPIVVGRIVGVCNADAAATTSKVAISVKGVYDLQVVSAGNGLSIGESVFIDPATAILSEDPADVPFGVALEAVAAGQTDTINIRLFGATPWTGGANS